MSGCLRETPEALYGRARTLRDQGKLKEVLAITGREIARPDSTWRFRFLHIEVQLAQRNAKDALAELDRTPGPASPEDRARATMYRAQAQFLLSDYARAEALLNEADSLAGDAPALLHAEIALRRGNLRHRQDRNVEAEQLFQRALKIAGESGDRRLEASTTGTLGSLFADTNRFDAAIYWLEQARSLFQGLQSATDVGQAVGNLGWCYFRLGDLERAESYLRQADASAQATGDRYLQQVWLGDLANVLSQEDNPKGAAEAFERALVVARDLGDRYWMQHWSQSLAATQIELGDLDAAQRSNNEAAELARNLSSESDLYIRLNEGKIAAARGSTAMARDLFRALIARNSTDPTPRLMAHSELAKLLVKTGDSSGADQEYRAALQEIESQQSALVRDEFRLSYLASLIRLCDEYVDFLVTRDQGEPALEVTESIRARVLNQRVDSVRGSTQQVSAAALRQAAGASGSTFLCYWVAPERSFLWVVKGSGIKLHVLPPAKQIASLVESYRSYLLSLRDPLGGEFAAGTKLAGMLLGPAREELRAGARIIVAPDRNLHALNFESLPQPDDPKHYLIEKVRVSVAPSLTLVASQIAGPNMARTPLLLIGDPDSAGKEYPKLPNAQRELALVRQTFPADQQVVVSGSSAVPAAYLQSSPERFGVIHFAAHATANPASPLDSALILSPSAAGYALTGREVMRLRLRASLVTLSACRSAGAKTYSGEGLVGLSWAFLRAGAGSVVAGLWDVTDMSTATLMGDFYGKLAAGLTPPDALREAKLNLVKSTGAYRKPFYWAPFQIYIGRR